MGPDVSTLTQSAEAHLSIEPAKGALRELVFDAIRSAGKEGLTCDQVEVVTGLRHQTASARVNELGKALRIAIKGTRPTRSGRRATVWVVPQGTG